MTKRFPGIVRVLLALALVAGLVVITAAPASAQVTAVGFTASPTRAGAYAQYVVGFTATTALTANVDTITVKFPAGVSLPATIKKEYASVEWTVTTVDPVVNQTANTITLITPVAVAASTAATVTFAQVAGIENPDFAAAANVYVGYVNTSADPTPVASTTYSAITTDVIFTPILGPVGTAISVSGVGFAPSMSMDITDAGAVVIGTGSTTATGTFAVTAYAATTSTGTLTATDGAGTSHTTTATFTVTPTLTLTPTGGLVGSTVRIQGSGFTAANVVAISVGGVPVSVATATIGTLDPYAAGTNGFAVAATGYTAVIVPASTLIDIIVMVPFTMTGGVKAIDARVVTAGANYANLAAFLAITPAATADFTVTPTTITLDPATGIAGIQSTVTGTGFPAYQTGGTITLTTLAGVPVGGFIAPPLFTTGIDGEMTPRVITIPVGTAPGTYVVTAAIAGASASATFTVPQPAIELSPPIGPRGATVTITGSNFPAYASVTLVTVTSSSGTIAVPTTPPTPMVGPDGTFGCTFIVPNVPVGVATVTVTAGGHSAAALFTVVAGTLTLSPTSGPGGTEVTVTGAGMTPNGVIPAGNTYPDPGLYFAPTTGSPAWNTVAIPVDSIGNLTPTMLMVPIEAARGPNTVEAIDSGGVIAATTFTVTDSVSDQLASISDCLVRVWGFDAAAQEWQLYDPGGPPYVNNLITLETGKGYWIKVTCDCTLVYGGHSYTMYAGWNLIGWLG